MEIKPPKSLLVWMENNEYIEPQYVQHSGWFAFKKGDVIPVCIHGYWLDAEYHRALNVLRIDLVGEYLNKVFN